MNLITLPTSSNNAMSESADARVFDVISNFGNKVQAGVRSQLEFAVEVAIRRYNDERNSFVLRRSKEADANCLKIDFFKGEFVSPKSKRVAYLVNFLGMIIMPVIGYLIGFPGPLVLNYFPRNLVRSQLAVSSSKQLFFKKIKSVNAWTWVLSMPNARKTSCLPITHKNCTKHSRDCNCRHRKRALLIATSCMFRRS